MKGNFVQPDFSDGIIEFRSNNEGVSIYANDDGLRWLAQKCLVLIDKNKQSHLHIEDYNVLTKSSLPAAIALFKDE